MKDEFLSILLIGLTLVVVVIGSVFFLCQNHEDENTYRAYVHVQYFTEEEPNILLTTTLMEDFEMENKVKELSPMYFATYEMPDGTIDSTALMLRGLVLGSNGEKYETHNVLARVPGKKVKVMNISTDCRKVNDFIKLGIY